MKKLILAILVLGTSIIGQAQKDTLWKIGNDTVKIGGLIIVNKKAPEKDDNWKTSIKI